MFSVELYGRVRHACHVEGLSQREVARRFGIHRNTARSQQSCHQPPFRAVRSGGGGARSAELLTTASSRGRFMATIA